MRFCHLYLSTSKTRTSKRTPVRYYKSEYIMSKFKNVIETMLVGLLFIGIAFVGSKVQAEESTVKTSSSVTCAELMAFDPQATTDMLIVELKYYETFYWLISQMPSEYITEWSSTLNFVCQKGGYSVEDTILFMYENTYENVFQIAKGA